MNVPTFHDLFRMELQDLYSMEQQIIEALPLMIEKTHHPELKRAFTLHLDETRKQAELVADLCKEFDVEPDGKHCAGIEGIIEEGSETLSANKPSPILDLAMIGIAQKVEHYEIAAYGTVINYAQEMGHTDAQDLLFQVLAEEKNSDEKLTNIAEAIITEAASVGLIAPVAA
jgi:ferritin-like metal-binding protein YciE